MRFGEIDIPEKLLEAQANNNLVIFAGSGVSKVSGFPDFKGLVNDAESFFRATNSVDPKPELDKRLGILVANGKDVHKYVHKKFSEQKEVAPLHKLSLSLFESNQKVKIVTTNYDTLFTKAITPENRKKIQHYHAPALPPGNGFEGIVHVHGSVATKPVDLVMTDSDFGKAYLTEGWARRFLVQMFNSHTVLFLGYSLDDTIVTYLSRALPPESLKYTFCLPIEADKWRRKGVIPIDDQGGDNGDKYLRRERCLAEWAEAIHGDFTWSDKKIQSIVVNRSAAPDPGESEFLVRALKDLATTRFFTRYAKTPDWLKWLRENDQLTHLFDPYKELTDAEREIARWVAEKFAVTHHQRLLEVIHKHGGQLNQDLWNYLMWQVTNNDPQPDGRVRALWLTVLLKNVPNNLYLGERLEYLLMKCKWDEDRYSILKLMGYLLEPVPQSELSLSSIFDDSVEFDIDFRPTVRGKEYYLNEVWSGLAQHIGEFWQVFLPTVQKHLTDAFQMSVAYEKARGDYDPQSGSRSAIEKHEQDSHHDSFDVLIDAARDILDYLLTTEGCQEDGKRLVELWWSTKVPLLRRIALHGLTISDQWNAEERIGWLLDNDLIHNSVFKHEVYKIIEQNLASCDEVLVKRVVDHALRSEKYEIKSERDVNIVEHAKFELLHWMHQYAPDLPLVNIELDKLIKANPNFKQSEYPDLNSWMHKSSQLEYSAPFSREDILAKPLAELSALLASYQGDEPGEYHHHRRSLLDTTMNIAVADFEWSLKLAKELAENGHFKNDIWYSLSRAWQSMPLETQQWETALGFLTSYTEILDKTHLVCELLEHRITKKEEIADSALSALEQFADRIWCRMSNSSGIEESSENWLTVAINHGAGKLGEFWIQALHKRSELAGESWKGIPKNYKKRFEDFIKSDSYAGELIRIILVSRLHYLYSHSQEWTQEHLLPLLDYTNGELRAEQAWHGFLMWGRRPRQLFDNFKLLYQQAAKKLKGSEEILRKHLFIHIIDTWLDESSAEPDFNWFYGIIGDASTTDADREQVADNLWRRLGSADRTTKTFQWSRYLKKYWADRNNCIPVALNQEEADKFIEWTTWLEPVYAEAVELACKTKGFELKQTSFFSGIGRSKLIDDHPLEVIELLVHVLKDSGNNTYQEHFLRPIYDRLVEVVSEEELKDLKNILLGLGLNF